MFRLREHSIVPIQWGKNTEKIDEDTMKEEQKTVLFKSTKRSNIKFQVFFFLACSMSMINGFWHYWTILWTANSVLLCKKYLLTMQYTRN